MQKIALLNRRVGSFGLAILLMGPSAARPSTEAFGPKPFLGFAAQTLAAPGNFFFEKKDRAFSAHIVSALSTRRTFLLGTASAVVASPLHASQAMVDDLRLRRLDDPDPTVRRAALTSLERDGIPLSQAYAILKDAGSRYQRHRLVAVLKVIAAHDPYLAPRQAEILFNHQYDIAVDLFEYAVVQGIPSHGRLEAVFNRFFIRKSSKNAIEAARLYLAIGLSPLQKAPLWQKDFLMASYFIAAAVVAQQASHPWTDEEYAELMRAIVSQTEVDPHFNGNLNFEFQVGPDLVASMKTPLPMAFAAAHQEGHRWAYLRSDVLRDPLTSLNQKAVDEWIADTFALMVLENAGLLSGGGAVNLFKENNLCTSCLMNPGQKILLDEAGRVLLSQLLARPQTPGQWTRLWASVARQVPSITTDVTFVEFARQSLEHASIPFDWKTFPPIFGAVLTPSLFRFDGPSASERMSSLQEAA